MRFSGLTDWDCHFIPGFHEFVTDESEALYGLSRIGSLGFSNVVLSAVLDPSRESVARHLSLRKERTRNLTLAAKKFQLRVGAYSKVLLSTDLEREKNLDRLCITKDGYLPLVLPQRAYHGWYEDVLKYLMYQRHFRLLFCESDQISFFCGAETANRYLQIPNAAFSFGFRALTDVTRCRQIARCVDRDIPVFLGSGLSNPQKCGYFELAYYLERGEENLPSGYLPMLLLKNQSAFQSCFSGG